MFSSLFTVVNSYATCQHGLKWLGEGFSNDIALSKGQMKRQYMLPFPNLANTTNFHIFILLTLIPVSQCQLFSSFSCENRICRHITANFDFDVEVV